MFYFLCFVPSMLYSHFILPCTTPFCFFVMSFSCSLMPLCSLQVLWEKQTRKQKNENKMRGNKASTFSSKQKNTFTFCVCAAQRFPVVPVEGIPSVPAEGGPSEERATPRGTTGNTVKNQGGFVWRLDDDDRRVIGFTFTVQLINNLNHVN